MKKLTTLFLGFAFSITAQTKYQLPENISPSEYMSNTIIFKVKGVFRNFCTETGVNLASLQKSFSAIGVTTNSKKFKGEQAPRSLYNKDGIPMADLSLIYECKFSSNVSLQKAINTLLASNVLEYAEPHFIPKPAYNPNDPQATVSQQYHINRINAYNAWNLSKGDTNVVIGITDTGVELTHSDLQANIKYNYADPIDMIDNDGDTYVDNFRGWDVGMNDNDPTWQGNPHGVHVSGIAAAATDNSVGIAGIGFNCKFLPVKIADGGGNLVSAYEGIKYAADHGCKVINCSWGGAGGGQYGQDICTYATINKDALVVAAAGNNGLDQLFYPAAYDYVLAVANTQANDVVNPSSNYGYFIDVCAPGTNVNATWTSNGYSAQTGTSMSSPVVAGAIAIVRSYFPAYTAMQAGERLKITADNIYGLPVNNGRLNKLGTGRINLFRALNDPAAPSVLFQNIQVTDKNDEFYVGGDTLSIGGLFTNYLAPTAALGATLVSLSAQATALNNTQTLGVINTLASVSNTSTPYKFVLSGSFASNAPLTFRLDMKDGSYTASQFFTVYANADYLNIYINDVGTTATSKGKIGYNQDNQAQGLGFIYQGVNLLWDAGLLIGVDSTKVSDVVRGTSASSDADFTVMNTISRITSGAKSNFDTYSKYNDNASASPIGVEVEQRNYAWSTAPNKKFVIWEYVIKNTSSVTYNNLYTGICADWDIDATTFANNKSAYDATNKMGYSWCTNAAGKYAGIKLLTTTGAPVFHAIDNIAGGGGGYDIFSSGYPTDVKYNTLRTNRLTAGGASTGNDVINVMSSGPHALAPAQSVTVAFALIAGDDLSDLQASAVNAQIKYNDIFSGINESNEEVNFVRMYPNPATNSLNFDLKPNVDAAIEVYDAIGRIVLKAEKKNSFSINTSDWSRGVYFVKVKCNGDVFSFKAVLN